MPGTFSGVFDGGVSFLGDAGVAGNLSVAGTTSLRGTATVGNLVVTGSTVGIFPAGMVVPFAGTAAPVGWLLCDGTAVSRITYATLFAAIGTAHGSGDGSTTFNLPDYRGRFLRGVDHGTGRDRDATTRAAMGTGGNAGDNVGSVEGDQFGRHDHGGGAHSHTFATSPCGHTNYNYSGLALDGDGTYGGNCGDDNSYTRGSGVIIAPAGGNENRPVNADVEWIIKF